MDFGYVSCFNGGITVHQVRNFEPEHIFECGQCFRWDRQENGSYIGVAFGRVLEVEKKDDDVLLYNTTEEEFREIWADYFDLYRDYGTIKEILSRDALLKKSVEFGHGIRILNQEPFEMILSFIISSNNRIPMIKRGIKRISEKWGKKLVYKGKEYYSFPELDEIKYANLEELAACGLGFRAKYIKATVDAIYRNSADIGWICSQDSEDCHKELQKFAGVGPKVADCIMLFSMGKHSAFPVDVWVKRAMQHFYLAPDVSLKKIREFGIDKFGELSGFAQQYLFYYARENNIKVE
ncbi:MAG: putative 8-oxoguanine glycosylase [Firmicutes bacterium]|nr:putative 8-oxoguanine glycosylase [Bacillota bacterium]